MSKICKIELAGKTPDEIETSKNGLIKFLTDAASQSLITDETSIGTVDKGIVEIGVNPSKGFLTLLSGQTFVKSIPDTLTKKSTPSVSAAPDTNP